ncbi:alpha/beta-type small acid-soluble spore protein [Brevibacillus composti]|uniref:Alpha/beta-type small acid-soluble spore protein n=1 Tax=Brevibacillus composti TaxID=2796470 RepID=A0A7T5EI58_9BACL|nr:alpha/beta-type small acid-soluble spore protein [Brevibacillus composti]QQE72998.1 alpha/beta-type small acid-soluble spore protein [Brevibacillus composti]QUO40076.1 alpha/beta-type small acid-soluble spore protein [Brevibacillus composti]
MSRRRRRPLVPGAQAGLDRLKAQVAGVREPDEAKYEIAQELEVPLQKGYNGQLTSHDAGRIGGHLGGHMVKELVRMAMEQLPRK